MIRVKRRVDATPAEVWSVLADGWLYPLWVVGASSIRDVDAAWPEPGARIHHSVGAWPALVHDTTSVVEAEPERWLSLRAGLWPAGEADVRLTLTPDGAGTEVLLEEEVASGPMSLIPKPVYGPLLKARNVESARRLANLAQNGAYRRRG